MGKVEWMIVDEALYLNQNMRALYPHVSQKEDKWVKRARLTFNVPDRYMEQRLLHHYIRVWKKGGNTYQECHEFKTPEEAIKQLERYAEERMPDHIKDWINSRSLLALMERPAKEAM